MRSARTGTALVAALLAVTTLAGCAGPPLDTRAEAVPTTGAPGSDPSRATTPATPTPTPAAVPPTTPPVTGPFVMAASVPLRLQIPAIGVDSELMDLGLLPDGTMEVPPGAFPAGWFTGAPTPGELGPAVLAGHVDWVTGPGVFADLASLAPGDHVLVSRADGTVADFAVTAVEEYAKDEFPTQLVYGDIDHAGLRLITCGGEWDRAAQHYDANAVVYAELVAVASGV